MTDHSTTEDSAQQAIDEALRHNYLKRTEQERNEADKRAQTTPLDKFKHLWEK